MTEAAILLDTCVLIFLAEGRELRKEALAMMKEAEDGRSIFVSPISAWEIGRGVASGRLAVTKEPLRFFNSFVNASSANMTDLSPDLLVASSFLPGQIHKDPFDRILIETARRNDLALMTTDRAILAYGAAGHVRVLPC